MPLGSGSNLTCAGRSASEIDSLATQVHELEAVLAELRREITKVNSRLYDILEVMQTRIFTDPSSDSSVERENRLGGVRQKPRGSKPKRSKKKMKKPFPPKELNLRQKFDVQPNPKQRWQSGILCDRRSERQGSTMSTGFCERTSSEKLDCLWMKCGFALAMAKTQLTIGAVGCGEVFRRGAPTYLDYEPMLPYDSTEASQKFAQGRVGEDRVW